MVARLWSMRLVELVGYHLIARIITITFMFALNILRVTQLCCTVLLHPTIAILDLSDEKVPLSSVG